MTAGTPREPLLSAREVALALDQPAPTDEQTEVIEAPLEPTLVVAGAGSGKTETMASRVVWLVVNGLVRPEEVLGLTFTRKAAIELGERLSRRLRTALERGLWAQTDDELSLPVVSTYHAYAGRLVSEHGLRWGVEPDSRLLSEASTWQLAHEVVHSTDADMSDTEKAPSTLVQAVLTLSGELAEHLVEPRAAQQLLERYAERSSGLPGRNQGKKTVDGARLANALREQLLVYPLVERYRALKRERGALDFADQMALAAGLAREIPQVGSAERQRYSAVLLDEFQDTSEAQLVLLTSLFAGHPMALTAVGDPHQSIYGWRGASATTLSAFPDLFRTSTGAPAPVRPLSTSWRNAEAILTAANETAAPLRTGSRVRVEPLRPRPGADQGRVQAARLLTHREEAEYAARWVRQRWLDEAGDQTGRSAAVLCRNRAQFDGIVQALRDQGLPVEVVGLGGLLMAPEVADLVALLTIAQDPTRGDALMRLLTGPVCRLGPADIDGLWAWARSLAEQAGAERGDALLSDAVDRPPSEGWTASRGRHVSETARERVAALGRAVGRVRSLAGLPLPDLLVEAERAIGLDLEVASDPEVPPEWGRAQLDALQEVAANFHRTAERATLGGFVEWLEAARHRERGLDAVEVPVTDEAEVTVSAAAVQVLTVHAAKGLEWDVVVVPGLSEATFPSYRGVSKLDESEWVVKPPTDGGWLTGLGRLPYLLRGDADGLPTLPLDSVADTHELRDAEKEFRAAGGRHALAEERRLAYVALTRARHELLLTSAVWSTGKTPRVTSRFLTELLTGAPGLVERDTWAPMPDPDDPAEHQNPLLTEDQFSPWPLPVDERRREVLDVVQAVLEVRRTTGAPEPASGGDTDPLAVLVDQLLRERDEAQAARAAGTEVALPAHLSTSGLVELARDQQAYLEALRRPVPRAPAHAARAGIAFHAWVEQHYGAASLVDLEELAPANADEGIDLSTMRSNFLASPWAGATPVDIEVAVETVLGGRAVRGRIDAVFAEGDGYVVLDWKTGSPGSPEQQRNRVLQLAAYRVAYARLRGVDPEQVSAAFFFAGSGQTVRPDLPSEEELEARVAELVG